MSENKFTPVEQVGRKALLKEIEESVAVHRDEVIKGIGDDAAVFKVSEFKATLLSTESYIEGVDFDLTYTPFHHLGYKLVTAVLSDIYAMNAKPVAITVGLSIPNRISTEMLKDFYKGINAAGQDYNVQLAGGDITGSHGYMAVNISAYAESEIEKVVYCSGAQIDDAICVTGDIGGALAGLKVLLREKKFWLDSGKDYFEPDLSEHEYVVKRQLVPIARRDAIKIFEENQIIPASMTDISQGLINDLKRITDASKKGAQIFQAALPIANETRKVADEMKEDVDNYALHGGEDYELLFTIPKAEVEKLSKIYKDFSVIGKIVPASEGLKVQTAEGEIWSYDK